jgi:hypothetical protein
MHQNHCLCHCGMDLCLNRPEDALLKSLLGLLLGFRCVYGYCRLVPCEDRVQRSTLAPPYDHWTAILGPIWLNSLDSPAAGGGPGSLSQ